MAKTTAARRRPSSKLTVLLLLVLLLGVGTRSITSRARFKRPTGRRRPTASGWRSCARRIRSWRTTSPTATIRS